MTHRVKAQIPVEMLMFILAGKIRVIAPDSQQGIEMLLELLPSNVVYEPDRRQVVLYWDLSPEQAEKMPMSCECGMGDPTPAVQFVGVKLEPKQ